MSNIKGEVGGRVIVYDRYLFAVPVKGTITGISDKDGAFQVTFDSDNPGSPNVNKHNGSYFHHQQCEVTNAPSLSPELVELAILAKPLIEYLNENYDPHTKIIITTDSSEVVSVKMRFATDEFIKD